MNEQTKHFIEEAIKIASKSIDTGGGPFGAIVVKDGEIIATGNNMVTNNIDPTAHAEVQAIRNASAKLGTFNLSGCEIYTSCEPCPMCLGAIYWARLDKVYFAANKNDAREAGFDDKFIYDELELDISQRKVPFVPTGRSAAIEVFKKWIEKQDKITY